jgi:hypothetical protein
LILILELVQLLPTIYNHRLLGQIKIYLVCVQIFIRSTIEEPNRLNCVIVGRVIVGFIGLSQSKYTTVFRKSINNKFCVVVVRIVIYVREVSISSIIITLKLFAKYIQLTALYVLFS